MKPKRIAHLTTAHPRFDVRIYHKEARSTLKKHIGFLIVADGKGDAVIDGLTILDIGCYKSRVKRMFISVISIYRKVIQYNFDIVHFHDPEMLLIAIPLKKRGIKVVYDVHENVHKQILTKKYLPTYVRSLLSKSFFHLENFVCKRVDAIVCATPSISMRFHSFEAKTYTVNNYPLVNELFGDSVLRKSNSNELAYVGVITEERGIIQLVKALGLLQGKYGLNLAGRFEDEELFSVVSSLEGWKYVTFYGQVDRDIIKEILSRSSAGVVNFLPAPNHMEAQPNKMFEYMSAGLPLICSDFPLWQELLDQYNCGVSINPLDPKSIAEQIHLLMSDTEKSSFCGSNGRKAISTRFNWDIEEQTLLSVYNNLL